MDLCVQTHNSIVEQVLGGQIGEGETGPSIRASTRSAHRSLVPQDVLLTACGLPLKPCAKSSAQQVKERPNSRNRTPFCLSGADPPSACSTSHRFLAQRASLVGHTHASRTSGPSTGEGLAHLGSPKHRPITVRGTNRSRSLLPLFILCGWCPGSDQGDICKGPKWSSISSVRHSRHLNHASHQSGFILRRNTLRNLHCLACILHAPE
ncbi:hypothetical protein NDU88_008943 [Pleurodeles waltl]|uniref:Uncharacterized protein n=1 Tax=Pleurodeles waltl TaxID=8319 RepID=A0AAV7RV89_PLEWA|nr:hypothetical protein NDU88_008943 [Pleurodeles waltl]